MPPVNSDKRRPPSLCEQSSNGWLGLAMGGRLGFGDHRRFIQEQGGADQVHVDLFLAAMAEQGQGFAVAQVQLDLAVDEAAFAGGEDPVELDGFHFVEGQGAVVAGQGDGLLASIQAGVAGGGEQHEQAGKGEGDGEHQRLHGAAPCHLREGNMGHEQGVGNVVELHRQATLGSDNKGQPHTLECPAAGDA